MPRVYETMRRAVIPASANPHVPKFTVRLWIEGDDDAYSDHAILNAANLARECSNPHEAVELIAYQVDRLNAVEVLDRDGNGKLIYPEWP